MQIHDQIAAPGVTTLFVDERGQPFTSANFGKYCGDMIQCWTSIQERLLPRNVRYIFATAASEGGIEDAMAWTVATVMGHRKGMWRR